MTTETNDQPEPIIWFEGTLISSPRQNRSAEDWLLETMAMGTATRKITIHASGRELLTPDELAQLDNDKCIYNLRGLHPFLSRKAWPGTTIARPKSTLRHSKEWKAAA